MTKQEQVLDVMKKQYGKTAFTEDHVEYRRVGFRGKSGTVSEIGDTWQEAIDLLGKKVQTK